MSGSTCSRRGCMGPARFRVGLLLYAEGDHDRKLGARASIDLVACAACARRLRPEDVLSEAGWQQIVMGLAREGRAAPRRSATQVLLLPLAAPARR